MAEQDENDAAAEEAAKGGGKKWIIIGVAVVLLGVGGFFGYSMFMGEPEAEEGEETAEEAPADQPALFASLHPPLVINFHDSYGDSHFMQMTLEVMAREQSLVDAVRDHAAVIRNALILTFSNLEYETVNTREGKQEMLDDALAEVQTIIENETGETGIEAVYFTGLIIQ